MATNKERAELLEEAMQELHLALQLLDMPYGATTFVTRGRAEVAAQHLQTALDRITRANLPWEC